MINIEGKELFEIDLTKQNNKFELASQEDADLMRIICYATTEGKNLNNVIFPRDVLLSSYKTFIDKPVVIVPSANLNPSSHGYDYRKQAFDNNKRINIGHITNAYPVIVNANGDITTLNNDDYNDIDGEVRIVAETVVYKQYFGDITNRLQFLHNIGDLSFSMEAIVNCDTFDDGTRVCTDIVFTGLAIVDNPAFVNSKSIIVAEEMEEHLMDFEKMYNDLKADYDTLVANNTANEEMANELAEVKTELAEVKGQLAEANSTIESLKPYKEKVEIAEKEALGKERASKLAKFGVEVENTIELAEKTANEFADMLCEAADKMVVVASEEPKEEIGMFTAQTTMASDKEKLVAIFKDFK